MTYVSRRTRIIVSRWLDECDADYRLQASRKRSDGRLKRYSSCDDIRAWVNDNCLKHEYLADLMSNGEFPGHSPFRLFGRFIPVPVLFQLAQGSKTTEAIQQSTQNQDVARRVSQDSTQKEARRVSQDSSQKVAERVSQDSRQKEARRVSQDSSQKVAGRVSQDSRQKEARRFSQDSSQKVAGGVSQDGGQNVAPRGSQDVNVMRSKSATSGKQIDSKTNIDDWCIEYDNETSDNIQNVSKVQSNSSLIRVQWEKNVLEKSLFECTCLLNKAMVKLERIDSIVALACEEAEKARTEDIREAFSKSRVSCSCTAIATDHNTYTPTQSSKYCSSKLKESAKCTELLRKISGLRLKLKKVQECRREVNQQIQNSKRRFECASPIQVTELYSRREQANIKKLQKKLEKLIAERGRLLSEMCQALTSLNNIKRSSKTVVSSHTRADPPLPPIPSSYEIGNDVYGSARFEEQETCECGCMCYENSPESEDSGRGIRLQGTDSYSSDNEEEKNLSRWQQNKDRGSGSYGYQTPGEGSGNYEDANMELDGQETPLNTQEYEMRSDRDERYGKSGKRDANTSMHEENLEKSEKKAEERGSTETGKEKTQKGKKTQRKSKVKFVCPDPPCRKKHEADDLSAFENTLTQEQLCIISEALEKIQQSRPSITQIQQSRPNTSQIQQSRPSTSPTTQKERESASLERDALQRKRNSLERRVKSETTMKEIEKTLRNYQRRLSDLDALEYKVEEMKEKMSENHLLRKSLAKLKADTKKEKDADRERSEREMSKLFAENWELKKQVQQLTEKFLSQAKKMQGMKAVEMRARQLECQAEELRKELSEYREGFEHQRNCISKWESVVAVQRTEIENLMNHIRMLTTVKEEREPDGGYRERKYPQRSRSYSPENGKGRKGAGQRKTQIRTFVPQQEEEGCCCGGAYPQQENRPMRGFERSYYTVESEWCN